MKLRIAIALTAALFSITPIHAFDEIKDCDVCPELVVVPAGQFMMGSPDKESTLPDEKPAHLVKIARPFAVGKFEVTFDQWDACVADGACKKVDDENWGRGNRPVINVDYVAAKTYAL